MSQTSSRYRTAEFSVPLRTEPYGLVRWFRPVDQPHFTWEERLANLPPAIQALVDGIADR